MWAVLPSNLSEWPINQPTDNPSRQAQDNYDVSVRSARERKNTTQYCVFICNFNFNASWVNKNRPKIVRFLHPIHSNRGWNNLPSVFGQSHRLHFTFFAGLMSRAIYISRREKKIVKNNNSFFSLHLSHWHLITNINSMWKSWTISKWTLCSSG